MAQLEVNFTLKGETSETTFALQERDGKFYLKGISAKSGTREFETEQNSNNVFIILNPDFEESDDIIEERMVGLSEEWIGTYVQGFDLSAETTDPAPKKPGYGPQNIFVEPKNFTLSQFVEMIKERDLEIAPRFQRNFIWDRTRKSRLIESIFLGLPLPTIYLSQYPDGRLTIVDGLQRINTIKEFLEDKFSLCNMEYFDFCNGKKFSELNLSSLQLRRFKQTVITCFVIDYRSPSQLKYDLFRRLNTGGKVLNDQEIRNCLARKPLQDTLYNMVNSAEFKAATCGSVKDTRMAAQESALRFIYFYDQYSENNCIGDYDGDMKSALDACVEELNPKNKEELSVYVDAFKKSMNLAHQLFGEYAFRKVFPGYEHNRKSSINKSLMLVLSVLLAKFAEEDPNTIVIRYMTDDLSASIKHDDKLNDAISWSTTSKKNLNYVFTTLKQKIRYYIARTPLKDILYNMVNSDEFKAATCGRIKDTRMAAQESVLQFIYFYDQYSENTYIGDYDGDIKSALDACVEGLNQKTENELSKYVDAFKKSMNLAQQLFGEYAFCQNRQSSINKSLMLVLSVLLAKYAEQHPNATVNRNLTDDLSALIGHEEYLKEAITRSTTSKKNIQYVFAMLKQKIIDRL